MTIPPPPKARALLEAAGLRPKKSWGQNFLTDQNMLAAIAREALDGDVEQVLELGAGLGALTYHLLAQNGRVLAIERDREIAPILRDALSWSDGLEVREADAAKLDYGAIAEELGGRLTVAGNLPYQISSRILVSLADAWSSIDRVVVLVQREVGERLVATPGNKTFGMLSVLVQRSFVGSIRRVVSPQSFHPPPKIQSVVVRLERRKRDWSEAEDTALVEVTRAAFSTRRKTLRNALSGALKISGDQAVEVIEVAGLDPKIRAERLDIDGFLALGRAWLASPLRAE